MVGTKQEENLKISGKLGKQISGKPGLPEDSLAYIYKIKLFKLMYNGYNDRLPVPVSDNIVTMRNTEYSLRRSENIAIPTVGFDLAI